MPLREPSGLLLQSLQVFRVVTPTVVEKGIQCGQQQMASLAALLRKATAGAVPRVIAWPPCFSCIADPARASSERMGGMWPDTGEDESSLE